MKLLVVEDEDRIASFLLKGLRAKGFEVAHAKTGAEALRSVSAEPPDLMVLDLCLPDRDGLEVLRDVRSRGLPLPVVVVTARGSVPERIEGLELGANDYLPKPFAFDELVARIHARLRDLSTTLILYDGLEVDLRARRVRFGGRTVELTSREFSLLEVLLRHRGQSVSRERLLHDVWGLEFDPGSNVVDVYVGYLRRKLREDLIETVRGTGYRLVSQPEAVPPQSRTSRI